LIKETKENKHYNHIIKWKMKQIKEVNGSKKDGNGVRGHTTLLSEDTEAKFFLEMSD